jgi:rhodanese-related sulfurtransferase
MKSRLACVAVIISAGFSFSAATAADHTKDTPADVKKNLADGKAQLIDVREASEWKAGHLKAAKLLSLSKLKQKPSKEELGKTLDEKKIVYLHCAAGVRVLTASELLSSQGYDVRPLKQGYADLLKAGFEKAEEKP